MRISCTKLATILNESKILTKEHTGKSLRNRCEAYGRDVRCTVYTETPEKKNDLLKLLKEKNISYDPKYALDNVCEIKVTYFKAWHWDE